MEFLCREGKTYDFFHEDSIEFYRIPYMETLWDYIKFHGVSMEFSYVLARVKLPWKT